MRFYIFLVFILSSQFLASQNLIYQSFGIEKSLTEDANAVVRLNEITIKINAIEELIVKKRRVITVLNKEGNRYINAREWYDESDKITSIEAVVYNQLGSEIKKIKQKDFTDVSAVGGGTLYSDSRVLYLEYTPTFYPYTVEFTVETKTKNTGFIPPWYFLDGYLVSTEKSKYTITYPSSDLKPIIKEKNLDDLNIVKTNSDTSITYEANNLKAIKYEELSPSFSKIIPQIHPRMVNFSYEGFKGKINNWEDVGLWMHSNHIINKDELPEYTKEIAKALTQNSTNDLEKAKIIYKYVQENTRYISVQVGIGGIQPISAIEVDKVKYGDCKGLSNYTKALLKEVGVTAYYTHVESGSDKVSFETDFPDLWAGDHVILAIPYDNKWYWVDCTSQVHPFGFIGDFTDGRQVLVIKPEGGELVSTTSYLNEENYQKTEGSLSISDDTSIEASIAITTTGIQYDNHFILKDKTAVDILKHYKDNWRNINNLNIKEYSFNNDVDKVQFTEKLKMSALNYGTKSGDRLLFSVNAFNQNNYLPNRYRNRQFSLEIQRGFLDEDEINIHLPENYNIEALPNAINLETDFGSYTITFDKTDNDKTVVYKRKLFIKEGEYPKERYEDYRNFRKEVAQNDNLKIVLIKK
jgi:hypothetical protein